MHFIQLTVVFSLKFGCRGSGFAVAELTDFGALRDLMMMMMMMFFFHSGLLLGGKPVWFISYLLPIPFVTHVMTYEFSYKYMPVLNIIWRRNGNMERVGCHTRYPLFIISCHSFVYYILLFFLLDETILITVHSTLSAVRNYIDYNSFTSSYTFMLCAALERNLVNIKK